MFKFILSCLYFFLPAYFTNMTPPLAKRMGLFNFLDKPIDFNKKLNGKPILGSHKTWRGAVLGTTVGIFTVYIQSLLYSFSCIKEISFIDYKENFLLFGFLISTGAVCGDLISAFFKRRLNLKPGAKFIPFDQTNYVIGSFVFLAPFFKINISIWLTLFVLTFFLHIIVNRLGYYLKIHQAKW